MPDVTEIEPEGEIDPPDPAEAVIVYVAGAAAETVKLPFEMDGVSYPDAVDPIQRIR